MASIREKFEIPGKMKTWSLALIAVGLVAFVIGLVTRSGHEESRYISGAIMYNTMFWTLVCNASMFFVVLLLGHGWLARRVTKPFTTGSYFWFDHF